jgi:dephospho-CoA kinase
MLKVGITGGIGSGKSTVCQVFSELGIPIYNADFEAKQLYFTDLNLKSELIHHFGESIYLSENELNKPVIREIISNEENRKILNSIVHPKVFKQFENWVKIQKSPYVLKEAAILFESGADKTVDTVIGVLADEFTRIKRVSHRDNLPIETIKKLIETQIPQEELRKRCNFIINNNGDESIVEQVLKIHQDLLNQSAHF